MRHDAAAGQADHGPDAFVRERRGDQQNRLPTFRAADEADPVPVDRRMGTQPVERRAEILQRDVLEDVRDSGEPEVRQGHDGVTLLGDEFHVPFLDAAFGAAEQDDTGEDGGRVRVKEQADETVIEGLDIHTSTVGWVPDRAMSGIARRFGRR